MKLLYTNATIMLNTYATYETPYVTCAHYQKQCKIHYLLYSTYNRTLRVLTCNRHSCNSIALVHTLYRTMNIGITIFVRSVLRPTFFEKTTLRVIKISKSISRVIKYTQQNLLFLLWYVFLLITLGTATHSTGQ